MSRDSPDRKISYLRRIMGENSEKYISVLLPLKIDWMPYYRLPQGESAGPGEWVRVNFANREYCGIVTGTVPAPDNPEKIKDILHVERNLPPVTDKELSLWKMVAEYYMCSAGEVFKAAYPSVRISQTEALAKKIEKERQRKEKAAGALKSRIAGIEDKIRQKEMLLGKSGNPDTKTAANLRAGIERLRLQANEFEKRLLALMDTGDRQGPAGNDRIEDITLTGTQMTVYREISGSQDASGNADVPHTGAGTAGNDGQRPPKPVLIKGVTGSGKTEIYLKTARETLLKGKNVLYLVPEIAVSGQLTGRVRRIFGDLLLTFHSDKSDAEKRDCAERIRRSRQDGTPYIVLGTRSALFLPHHDLGLVIVDEEHDSSYKQDSPAPRYNGRDVAVMLATLHKCQAILGSATPSLESVFNCICGKYGMLTLTEKFYGAPDAEVEIIDTAAERRKRGMSGSFSKKLIDRINGTLGKGGQVLILRARRAFSPVLQCPGCGMIPKCPRCNVSLSLHKNPDRMVCHHCGYTAAFNPLCPKCGSTLQGLGSGTQKIEEEAQALFPHAKIGRLDSDTSKSAVTETIRQFDEGGIDILIGTQIISKGFDFPGLALTAVIAADSLLGIQDFRADEKAMQVLEQLRGRCGRRDRQGTFIIQTYKPEHPVYRHLADGDSEALYEGLMQERREFGYPPFSRLIYLTVKDMSEEKADRAAQLLSRMLKSELGGAGGDEADMETVSGPFRPVVDKAGGYHLRMLSVMLPKNRSLQENKKVLARTVSLFGKRNGFAGRITIDVDPE